MIIDDLSNNGRYASLHPNLAKGFEWLASQDLSTIAVGKYGIDGKNVHAAVSEKDGTTKEAAKFEAHELYADIQLSLTDGELYGWKARKDVTSPTGDYNPEKDVIFFSDEPTTYFTLNDRQFAIFFPQDVHKSNIGEGVIRKLVVKVKL
jgi:biofilm protein TabA